MIALIISVGLFLLLTKTVFYWIETVGRKNATYRPFRKKTEQITEKTIQKAAIGAGLFYYLRARQKQKEFERRQRRYWFY